MNADTQRVIIAFCVKVILYLLLYNWYDFKYQV